MLSDLRFSLRLLAKSPGFTGAAVLTLALALGANSAVFSLVNAALFRPVGPSLPGETVNLYATREKTPGEFHRFSQRDFEILRETRDLFAMVAGILPARVGLRESREEGQQRSFAHLTTADYFSLLGTTPAQGRFYDEDEARPDARRPVAVASHALWQRLGAPPDLVGSVLWINNEPCTIIGIAREDFTGGSAIVSPELWLPLGLQSQITSLFHGPDRNAGLQLLARTQPGVTVDAVRARLPALARQLTDLQPTAPGGGRQLQAHPLSRAGPGTRPPNVGDFYLLATPLLLMAGCVLLIASLNLANMLLARGAARSREIAIRLAVGASRARIIRQLLVEGLVLSLAGGTLGLLLSWWANAAMLSALSAALQGMMQVSLALQPEADATVLGLTFLACVLATLLFSLAPALRASRSDVVADLKAAGTTVTGGNWNRFFAGRHLLVMAQVALSLVLLFSAGLFLRGALSAGSIPLGFDPAGGIVTEVDFSLSNTPPAHARRSLTAALERIEALPAVERAAATTHAPMDNLADHRRVEPIEGSIPLTDGTAAGPKALTAGVTPGYFSTISVPLLRGRDFTGIEADDASAPPVVIIDVSLARKLFPDGDALGRRVRFPRLAGSGEDPAFEIVGIVGEHRHEFLQVEPTFRIFLPFVRAFDGSAYIQTDLRRADRAGVLVALGEVRHELQRLDPTLPVLRHEPFSDFIDREDSLWSARLGAVVFGIFGAIALLLSVMGVYSVKAYAVACRTRELGIRLALGARPGDVLRLIVRQGALQIAFAAAIGLVLALLTGRLLTALLFHISPADPLALAGATLVLSGAGLLACWLPARRATRVNPLTALRSE